MSSNLYKRLRALVPTAPRLYGAVQSVDAATGAVVVALPGGATVRAVGEAEVGDTVFVRDGVIEGPAPALPVETIEV